MSRLIVRLILTVALLLCAKPGSATHPDAVGDIQITGAPGMSIFVDGVQAGESNAFENGLFLENIPAGTHLVKVLKQGYHAYEKQVEVVGGQTTELQLELKTAAASEKKAFTVTGALLKKNAAASLLLRSVPLHARVSLDGREVGETDIELNQLEPGKHTVRFVYRDKSLSADVTLVAGGAVSLKGHFKEGKVLTSSTVQALSENGPEVVVLHSKRNAKPARFPHGKHQEIIECGECHHGQNDDGEQIPFETGMPAKKCGTCHNLNMANTSLSKLRLVAHMKCKGCHKKMAETGEAGPIDKCSGCHPDGQ